MDFALEGDGLRRLEAYFERIGSVLGDDKRRASFATYAIGLLSDGERKSMEPIAARACADPERIDAEHQRLAHFVSNSNWRDKDVRREAAAYALEVLTKREPVVAWIFDDTGFLKQGSHSVGVQRQYTGSAGKITNCQIGVSLTVATPTEHLPIDFELYLPQSWTEDPARRLEARIPDEVQFQTKSELAIVMLRRAVLLPVFREARCWLTLPTAIAVSCAGFVVSSNFRTLSRSCRRIACGALMAGVEKSTTIRSRSKTSPSALAVGPSARQRGVKAARLRCRRILRWSACAWFKATASTAANPRWFGY